MTRTVLHVDMNAYFASVEQKANPLLRGKPVLVVADSRRRTVVMTASYEARPFGVKTGMNLYEAKKLCPQAVVVDGDSEKYLYSTSQLLDVFESFTDQVEMFSCDEAFLDVTGSRSYFRADGEGIARIIKARIKERIGLPCSVGVAPNKLLAKLASEKQKPDGLTVIATEDVERCLAETPVEDLCGVGDKLVLKLEQIGIRTCKQLGDADIGLLENVFGFWAYWLKRMGQGRDDSPVRRLTDQETVKSMGHSTTFPRDASDPEILRSFLLLLSEKVALRLRRGGFQSHTVTLTVRYKDFTTFTRQSKGKEPLDDGYAIYSVALKIMRQITLEQPVRLLGVSVSSLISSQSQEVLFEALFRRGKLNGVVDRINRKFGLFTLRPAGIMHAEKFGVLDAPIPPSQHGIIER